MICENQDRPIRRKLEVYQGTEFSFSFRIKNEGKYIVPDNVFFRLMDKVGGSIEDGYDLSFSDSPSSITIDDEKVITVTIPKEMTSDLDEDKYYEIDVDISGVVKRRFLGDMVVYRSAGN